MSRWAIVGVLVTTVSAAGGPLLVPGTPPPTGSQTQPTRSDTLVYDNTVNATGYYAAFEDVPGSEIEDDVTVATGAPFTMTRFAVSVYYPSAGTATVNFYLAGDTGGPTPPSVLTHTFDVIGDPDNVQFLSLSGLSVPLPPTFYIGLSGTGTANGWPMFAPPVLGSSQDLFYIDLGGPWWFSPPWISSFCAAVYTPEPSVWLALSLTALLARRRG
jgi:hypothetical protein